MSSKKLQEENHDYKEILQELKDYLDSNDIEMASLLLSDQNQQKFLKNAKNQVSKSLYDQIVKIFKTISTNKISSSNQICELRSKIIQKEPELIQYSSIQHQEKLVSDDQQSDEQEVSQGNDGNTNKKRRKRRKKIVSIVGYPYYGIIKQLLFAHGIFNPEQQLIKMLHTRVQIMFSEILTDDVIKILQKNKKITHYAIEQYLKELFTQQYQFLMSFLSKCKTVDKKLKDQSSSNDSAFYSSSQDKVQHENRKQQKYSLLYSTQKQKNFFKALTSQMSQQSFRQYSMSRQVNFLYFGINEFRKFICTNPALQAITKKRIFELFSFIGCRFFRKVILLVIQNKFGELRPLKECQNISAQEIKSTSNELISQLSQKVQKLKSVYKAQTSQDMGYQIFKKQFIVQDYESLLPKQIIEQAQKNIKNAGNIFQLMDYIWQQQPRYRKLWMNRAFAEESLVKQKNPNKKCLNYYKFLKENIELFNNDNGPFLVWRKYFTGSEDNSKKSAQEQAKETKQDVPYRLRNKRKKLESLIDN